MKRYEIFIWFAAWIGAVAAILAVLFFALHFALKDVTLDGIAESAGRAATTIERAYERGKTESQ